MLGYIDPNRFLGGKIRLRLDHATKALERQVAEPLGITVTEAAWEIKRLIDGIMGQEMCRICSLMSGRDPREFCAEAYAMRDFQRLLQAAALRGHRERASGLTAINNSRRQLQSHLGCCLYPS
jgi:N-methylhydantoinase A/oxoprolinase/acetone carboxylase beta subunit